MLNTPSSNREKLSLQALDLIDQHPLYLDTETTGLKSSDEIIEISIIDHDGTFLLSSLVKPSQPIPQDVQTIHGISNIAVANAPAWPFIWPQIRSLLFGKLVIAYNSPFDLKMMQQSHTRYHLPWRENFNFFDLLPFYGAYIGEWDQFRGSLKYHKLAAAGQFFKIPLPNAHRSAADAQLTRAVLHAIAGVPY